MEPTQGTQVTTPVSTSTPSPGLFGTKIPSSIAFLIAVLLFLLPFAEIRCNGAAVASNSGLGIATGREWKETSKSIFGNGFQNDPSSNENKVHKQYPNILAINALALGVIGVFIAFLTPTSGGKFNLIVGTLAAVSLIEMLIDLRSRVRSDDSVKSSGLDLSTGVTVDATAGFYFAIILFILGGIFSYLREKGKQPT